MLINKIMKTLLLIIFIFFSINVHANTRINEDQGLIEILELGFDIIDVVELGGYLVYILQHNGNAGPKIVHCYYTGSGMYKECWQVKRNK